MSAASRQADLLAAEQERSAAQAYADQLRVKRSLAKVIGDDACLTEWDRIIRQMDGVLAMHELRVELLAEAAADSEGAEP